MILLYRANQFGKKISKLYAFDCEYLLANTVNGQNMLNSTRTIPSPITTPIAIHVKELIWLLIPEYKI